MRERGSSGCAYGRTGSRFSPLVTLVYVGYTAYQRSNSGEALSLAAILTLGIVGVIFVYLLAASRAFRRPAGIA